MSKNDYFLQLQADLIGRPLIRTEQAEATALGAAFLAGLHAGIWPDLQSLRSVPMAEQRFQPALPAQLRQQKHRAWQKAVATTIAHYHAG
jgi:glycerol kinase